MIYFPSLPVIGMVRGASIIFIALVSRKFDMFDMKIWRASLWFPYLIENRFPNQNRFPDQNRFPNKNRFPNQNGSLWIRILVWVNSKQGIMIPAWVKNRSHHTILGSYASVTKNVLSENSENCLYKYATEAASAMVERIAFCAVSNIKQSQWL